MKVVKTTLLVIGTILCATVLLFVGSAFVVGFVGAMNKAVVDKVASEIRPGRALLPPRNFICAQEAGIRELYDLHQETVDDAEATYIRDKFGCRAAEDFVPIIVLSEQSYIVAARRLHDKKTVFVPEGALKQFGSYEEEATFVAKDRASAALLVGALGGGMRETSGWQTSRGKSDQIIVDYGYYSAAGEKHLRWRYDLDSGALTPITQAAKGAETLRAMMSATQ